MQRLIKFINIALKWTKNGFPWKNTFSVQLVYLWVRNIPTNQFATKYQEWQLYDPFISEKVTLT